MSDNRFCFIAIVRDESRVIERCLASIVNLATSYLICDTGSVDDTIPKIVNYMANAEIPGEVITHPWKNYGYNKSYLLEQLRIHPIAQTCKYFMWHDADEVFIVNPNDPLSYPSKADADKLFAECESHSENIVMFKTLYGGTKYNRWQIARNNQKYRWEMPFQEYFVAEKDGSSFVIDWMYNLARKEGNSSQDPGRDRKGIRMLKEYLEDHPDEPRTVFYLAQTYKDVGEKELACEWYDKRMGLAGYFEEKYLSGLYASRLTSDESLKIKWLKFAISVNPNRLEAYYDLMMISYNKGDHQESIKVGDTAPENPSPGMFSETYICDFLFDINYSVSCYYAGKYDRAFRVGMRLLARPSLSESDRKRASENMKFFIEKIPKTVTNPLSLEKKVEPRAISTDNKTSSVGIPKTNLPIVTIIDNFYENPDEVRKFALAQKFQVKGNYPGGRTESFATPDDQARFEQILNRKINYFPGGYNGSFQLVTAQESSWIHRDQTQFSALIFLTPKPAEHSGTILYRHRATGLERTFSKEEEAVLNADSRNYSAWEMMDRIGNKYNRCIIFQGIHSHTSDQYFGTDMETGRLFQIFFFNVVDF